MRLVINAFKAALVISCLAVAACGDNSPAVSQASANSDALKASISEASAPPTASLSGTTIPTATQIIDGSGNVWTVSGGVIYENGALAGYSNAVAKLLYDNNTVYQENAAGGWWSWNGSTWVSSADPTAVPSPNGTSVPTTTQIIDSSGNVWTVSGGVVYKDGALAGYTNAVAQLLYDDTTIYTENAAGRWWSWNGNAWVSSDDPIDNGGGGDASSSGSASLSWTAPTQNTDGTPLTDLAGYTIYYGTDPSALTQTIQLADRSATTYVVSNLSAGTYYFAVAAYTTTGTQSAQSSGGSKTIP